MSAPDWEREWERTSAQAEVWERRWEVAEAKLHHVRELCDRAVQQGIGLGFQEQVRAVLEGRDPWDQAGIAESREPT